jgi:hypothetical protein
MDDNQFEMTLLQMFDDGPFVWCRDCGITLNTRVRVAWRHMRCSTCQWGPFVEDVSESLDEVTAGLAR